MNKTNALEAAPNNVGHHYVNGEWVPSTGDGIFSIVNPATEDVVAQVTEASLADIERAVNAARLAFDAGPWPRMSPKERAVFLSRIADGIQASAGAFGSAWTTQTGALCSMATPYSAAMADVVRSFVAMADTFEFEERCATPMAAVGLRAHEPVGVVAAIIPWNAPLMLMVLKLAPALLAGCTVILKTSPEAPMEGYLLAQIVADAGIPAGVVNVLTADRSNSEALVRHPGVDKVSFTGSSGAGKRIASLCGERVARVTLELGGKSPAIILDDCDPEVVVAGLLPVVSTMAGQTCAALTRVIVSRRRHDEIVEALKAGFESLQVGDPTVLSTAVGPVSMQRQYARVMDYIAVGTAEGAQLVTGGGRPGDLDRGYFVRPTLFTEVSNSSRLAQEEIFGPVLSVVVVDSEEQAIAVANDTLYGLNSAIFTQDAARAYAVARQLRAGTVGQNGYRTDFNIGFGGFKQSGIGREGGVNGLRAYLEPKTILLDGLV